MNPPLPPLHRSVRADLEWQFTNARIDTNGGLYMTGVGNRFCSWPLAIAGRRHLSFPCALAPSDVPATKRLELPARPAGAGTPTGPNTLRQLLGFPRVPTPGASAVWTAAPQPNRDPLDRFSSVAYPSRP